MLAKAASQQRVGQNQYLSRHTTDSGLMTAAEERAARKEKEAKEKEEAKAKAKEEAGKKVGVSGPV